MRLSAIDEQLTVIVAGFFENARMLNQLLSQLNPGLSERLIHLEPGNIETILHIRDRIEAGDMVALAADRVGLNEKSVRVDFFGAKAAFPTGPWILASALKCPVYLTVGIYRDPNRYDLHCELISERIRLPRKGREAALEALVQDYASALEARLRQTPDNWFNFYDFWA